MEPRPEQTYTQQSPALQRYVTKFKWVLPDWTLLYDTTYSKGFKSDSFPLVGLDSYTCQISLNPQDENCNVHVLFSDIARILAVKICLQINGGVMSNFYISQPAHKTRRLEITCLPKKTKKLSEVLGIESSEEANDTLTILATFVIIKFPKSSICKNPSTNVLKKIKTLFDNKKLCDVTLALGDVQIPVHKNVLAAHSKVFEAMFSSTTMESEQNRVEIVDVESEVFKKFIDYLYSGEVDVSGDSVEAMITLADKYQITELKTLCENYMLEILCKKNVVQFIIIADKLNCVELKNKSLSFIDNSSSVFKNVVKEGDLEVTMSLKKILDQTSKQ